MRLWKTPKDIPKSHKAIHGGVHYAPLLIFIFLSSDYHTYSGENYPVKTPIIGFPWINTIQCGIYSVHGPWYGDETWTGKGYNIGSRSDHSRIIMMEIAILLFLIIICLFPVRILMGQNVVFGMGIVIMLLTIEICK